MPSSTHALRPICASSPTPEERCRTVLQAIAAARPGMGRAITGVEAQELARRVLVEMGKDRTKRALVRGRARR